MISPKCQAVFFIRLFSVSILFFTQTCWGRHEWPEFRGPSANGHSKELGLPLQMGENENVVWKTPIHGKGWSSPVVSGERVWLTTAKEDGTELSVLAIDSESGGIVFDEVLFQVSNPQFCHKFNSYASPTPVIADGKVFVSFGSPGIACLDEKTGRKIWERRDFVCNHYRGAGSSPIVWGHLLILNFDGSDAQFVVALDCETGRTVWRTERSIDFLDLDAQGKPAGEGDYRKAFATPVVVNWEGKALLISSGAKAHYAYDALTGEEVWRLEERGQHSASTRPIVAGDTVYIQTGFGKPQLLAVLLGGKGVLAESQVKWRMKKGVPSKPSILMVDQNLFMVDDAGVGSCVDANTGEYVWTQRIGGNFSASPIFADGRIYAFNEEGKAFVIAAEKEFRLISEGKFEHGFMASPAVARGALFLRSKTALYRVSAHR